MLLNCEITIELVSKNRVFKILLKERLSQKRGYGEFLEIVTELVTSVEWFCKILVVIL